MMQLDKITLLALMFSCPVQEKSLSVVGELIVGHVPMLDIAPGLLGPVLAGLGLVTISHQFVPVTHTLLPLHVSPTAHPPL